MVTRVDLKESWVSLVTGRDWGLKRKSQRYLQRNRSKIEVASQYWMDISHFEVFSKPSCDTRAG